MQFPFSTTLDSDKNIIIHQDYPVLFTNNPLLKCFVHSKAAIHILGSAFSAGKPFSNSEKEIIKSIHTVRFNPKNGYIITGGHFADLYVRNIGIFYNALLDPRIPSSEEDWIDRQKIALQTVAFALEIFSQAKKSFTTIVPLMSNYVTARNVYTEPSDSLFGILYALSALSNDFFVSTIWKSNVKPQHKLRTQKAGKQLLTTYKKSLQNLLGKYFHTVLNNETHLIKKDITLAPAADGIKRQSSFYDNVITWATARLASDLGILSFSKKELEKWKEKIVQGFWDEENGIFLNDLSGNKTYFSDWLIVIASQFFSVEKKDEREKLEKIVFYIERNKLDQPFPLPYSNKNDLKNYYLPVAFAAPDYMGKAIWSHWGMEYIKLLILLSKENKKYREKAEKFLALYKNNIITSGGYPELYGQNGKNYQTPFYKGVLQNGWIINYEQTKTLLYKK